MNSDHIEYESTHLGYINLHIYYLILSLIQMMSNDFNDYKLNLSIIIGGSTLKHYIARVTYEFFLKKN